ncbi:MAG: serine/threonine-protein kinase, partial [Myxococcota bacterium]
MAINSDNRDGAGLELTPDAETAQSAAADGSASGQSDTPPSEEIAAEIERLVAAGRYADAAGLARERGALARAAELYERIWDFASAAECARAAGDIGRALRNAIDARDEDAVAELSAAAAERGPDGQRMAFEIFTGKRRFGEAAELAEAMGELDSAVEHYKSAHRELDAARLLERLGRDREAGRMLERFVELGAPGPERARAQLRLGLLLARRMDHAAAARYLQEAAANDEVRAPAQRALVVSLAAMGLRDAARDVLVAARAEQPQLPVDIDTFLKVQRAEPGPADGVTERDGEPRERPSPARQAPNIVGGRYRLGELIGTGGSGRVFRAHDEVRDRACALKIFHMGSSRGNQAYERFIREAKLASALNHPNLVEVFDVSADQGYLVMELMSGGSLAMRVAADGALSGAVARRIALDVLSGLELAHQRGVIHRDVSPGNLMLT